MTTRQDLEALLDALETELPHLVEDNPSPSDFWPAFAGAADLIEDSASDGTDARYVQERIDNMLARHGMRMARFDVEDE